MNREWYEEPEFKVVMFETEESLMTISNETIVPGDEDESWSPIVKP